MKPKLSSKGKQGHNECPEEPLNKRSPKVAQKKKPCTSVNGPLRDDHKARETYQEKQLVSNVLKGQNEWSKDAIYKG